MSTRNYLTHTKRYKTLLSSLHSVYRVVNSTFELNDLVTRMSRLVCQLFAARNCQMLILDPSKRYSLFKCLTREGKKYCVDKKTLITDRLERKIIKTTTAVKNSHLLAMPLIGDDIIGLIVMRRAQHDPPFDHLDHEMFTTVSEQVTVGIKNLQLYDEQQKIIVGSIKSLVSLLDIRVPQEYAHSPYFSRLVTAVGEQMHMDQKQIDSLKYASLLHDAGKVDIPLEILTKTTKLTPQEYKIIRTHPLKGAQILRPLQILRPAIPIIMHHHERYNGSGYPARLKKNQIPQGARVMAVVDAFEAMVYGRPYRERMDVNSAIKEIKKKSGTQFDPKVVEGFMRVVKQGKLKKYLQYTK